VKLLAAEANPEMSEQYVTVNKKQLLIGPCTIRKRHIMTFGLLVDGAKPKLSYRDAPLNVKVRQGADGGEPPRTFWRKTVLVGAGAVALAGGAAGVAGVGLAGIVGAGAAGADTGLTELAVAAGLSAVTAATTWVRRRWSQRQHRP
jgi:hypothetical protein